MSNHLWKRIRTAVFCFCMTFLFTGAFLSLDHAQAAVRKTGVLKSSENTSCKLDLNGDGRMEKVELKTSYDEEQMFFSTVRFYVDGKEALSYRNMQMTLVMADYVQMNDSDIFLRIYTTTDNDCAVTDRFYVYDAQRKKLVEAAKLLEEICGVLHAQAEIKNVNSTGIRVTYQMQFDEIGRVRWNSSYAVQDGKLSLKSKTMKVTSIMGDTMLDEDGYNSRFDKNQYQAMKKIRLYENTDLKHVSFTAAKKDILKLTKIKYADESLYVQFSKGTKTGWMKLGQSDLEDPSRMFYGVASRLAG